jgi:hypothetical protein
MSIDPVHDLDAPASPVLALPVTFRKHLARLGDGATSRRMKVRISVSFGILQESATSPNVEVI